MLHEWLPSLAALVSGLFFSWLLLTLILVPKARTMVSNETALFIVAGFMLNVMTVYYDPQLSVVKAWLSQLVVRSQ